MTLAANDITNNSISKFEVGETYTTRSVCDYDCIFSYEVVRRTAKSVWVKARDGEIVRRAVKVFPNTEEETIFPEGYYSMCPVLKAG